jgi:hypothetical protein
MMISDLSRMWPNAALEPTAVALELTDEVGNTKIIELGEPLAGRPGSALDG